MLDTLSSLERSIDASGGGSYHQVGRLASCQRLSIGPSQLRHKASPATKGVRTSCCCSIRLRAIFALLLQRASITRLRASAWWRAGAPVESRSSLGFGLSLIEARALRGASLGFVHYVFWYDMSSFNLARGNNYFKGGR